MSRPGPDGAIVTVTTMKGIDDLILSFNCKDYKAEILTADAQASHMKGVIVLVTGCLTGKDYVRRKFTESFFLAPHDHGYFVLNNAFRFIENDSLIPVEEEPDTTVSAAPVTPVQGTLEVPDNSLENQVAVEQVAIENNLVEGSDPSENKQKETVRDIPQAPVESTRSAQPVVETLSNGHVDASKKSYASLLKGMKDGATATMVHTPTSAVKARTANTPQPTVVSSAKQDSHAETLPANVSEATAPNDSNGSTSSNDQAKVRGYSIYIGGLPWNATIELVENEFKKFGPIKHNGIQVRSSKGFCFGFVEFEDANARQKAIEMATIRIGGKEVFIEEKKTNTQVVNGVSTYPSGRGGFRNEGGYRGRGNFSNGRGYGRNDYSKRNGEAPPRSNYRNQNGDGFQTVYQNGRGRGGARQGQGSAPNPK